MFFRVGFNMALLYLDDLKNLSYGSYFVHIILENDKHPRESQAVSIFLKHIDTEQSFIIPINHIDSLNNITTNDVFSIIKDYELFCIDKKCTLQSYNFSNLFDISLNRYLETGNIYEDLPSGFENFYESKNIHDYNKFIPSLLFLEYYDLVYVDNKKYIKKSLETPYQKLNELYYTNFAKIENNGMCVEPKLFKKYFNRDVSMVYTQYNLYSSTGRPSNRFANVNYAALNKKNGCRKSFISRFKNDGALIMFDYSSFHPRLIANLIGYELGYDTDVYRYFSEKLYPNKDISNDVLMNTKTLIFEMLYGGVENDLLKLQFFKKTKIFIDNLWEFYKTNKFILTPLFKRKIDNHNIVNVNKHKLFNYLLQAYELEFNLLIIKDLNDLLDNKKTKFILYTYDSFLFDFCKSDGKRLINDIKKVLEKNKQFPVKMYFGNNYDNMVKINTYSL